jgi:hypothetical protein
MKGELSMKGCPPSTNDKGWEQILEEFQLAAASLPAGDAKEAACRKVQQLKKAVEIRNWLASPSLQPPR